MWPDCGLDVGRRGGGTREGGADELSRQLHMLPESGAAIFPSAQWALAHAHCWLPWLPRPARAGTLALGEPAGP